MTITKCIDCLNRIEDEIGNGKCQILGCLCINVGIEGRLEELEDCSIFNPKLQGE